MCVSECVCVCVRACVSVWGWECAHGRAHLALIYAFIVFDEYIIC